MSFAQKSQARLKNMSLAITRFWFSILFFLATTGTVMFAIETETDLGKEILTLLIAGLLGIAVRLISERLFNRPFKYHCYFTQMFCYSLLVIISIYITQISICI